MIALQFKPLMFLGIELTRSYLLFPTFFISGKFLRARFNFLVKQMGVKYSGDLKSRPVRILNSLKEVGLQMVSISNGIWNPESQPFEIRTKMSEFQMVEAIDIAKAGPFENWSISNPTFKTSAS